MQRTARTGGFLIDGEVMTLDERYDPGLPLSAFLDTATERVDLWRSIYERARIPEWAKAAARTLPSKVRMLVLLEDWCTDAMSTIPMLAALADRVPGKLELRVLRRDENLDLMDAHLSPTGGRAIPVVMLLDESGMEIGWWGSRPAGLQAWIDEEGRELPAEERIRYVRRWYAQDRGASTLREVLALAGAEPATEGRLIA